MIKALGHRVIKGQREKRFFCPFAYFLFTSIIAGLLLYRLSASTRLPSRPRKFPSYSLLYLIRGIGMAQIHCVLRRPFSQFLCWAFVQYFVDQSAITFVIFLFKNLRGIFLFKNDCLGGPCSKNRCGMQFVIILYFPSLIRESLYFWCRLH